MCKYLLFKYIKILKPNKIIYYEDLMNIDVPRTIVYVWFILSYLSCAELISDT